MKLRKRLGKEYHETTEISRLEYHETTEKTAEYHETTEISQKNTMKLRKEYHETKEGN